jgi:hypothetical protein
MTTLAWLGLLLQFILLLNEQRHSACKIHEITEAKPILGLPYSSGKNTRTSMLSGT